MFGFLIGALCVFGLVKVLRHGRGWGGGRHCHGRGRRHGWHDHDGERGSARGTWWLRGLFERLDTTPGQERVIREAVQELRDAARGVKDEVRDGREAVSQAMRAGTVDETQLGELFARQDDRITELRKAFVGSLAKVHEALDEDQRKRLADLIASKRGFGWGGPYRSWA